MCIDDFLDISSLSTLLFVFGLNCVVEIEKTGGPDVWQTLHTSGPPGFLISTTLQSELKAKNDY